MSGAEDGSFTKRIRVSIHISFSSDPFILGDLDTEGRGSTMPWWCSKGASNEGCERGGIKERARRMLAWDIFDADWRLEMRKMCAEIVFMNYGTRVSVVFNHLIGIFASLRENLNYLILEYSVFYMSIYLFFVISLSLIHFNFYLL